MDENAEGTGVLHSPVIDSDEAEAAQAYAEASRTIPPARLETDRMIITQHHARYTDENHEVWRILFEKRMAQLQRDGSRVFLDGVDRLGIDRQRVPRLADINASLSPLTHWESVAVPGFIPAKAFFAFLAKRQFPTTVTVRPKARMNYLPEPDIIHDVFGHVPLHADPEFAEFLQTYGEAALVTDDPYHTERLARLFWFTVEFGLIREEGRLKLYGAGLLSSEGEGHHALYSPEVERRPFDLDRVCDTPFEIHHYQPILYVLESFGQLKRAMNDYAGRLLALSKGSALDDGAHPKMRSLASAA